MGDVTLSVYDRELTSSETRIKITGSENNAVWLNQRLILFGQTLEPGQLFGPFREAGIQEVSFFSQGGYIVI